MAKNNIFSPFSLPHMQACLPAFQFSTFGRQSSLLSVQPLPNALRHRRVLECPQLAMGQAVGAQRRGSPTPLPTLALLLHLSVQITSAAQQCQQRETAPRAEHHQDLASGALALTSLELLRLERHQGNCVWTTPPKRRHACALQRLPVCTL